MSQKRHKPSPAMRLRIAYKCKWTCFECHEMLKPSFHVDHHIPLSDGGSNHIDNLVPLCGTCHAEKTQIENIIRNVEKSKVSKYFSLVNPSPPISDALLKSFRLKKSQHL